MLLLLLNETSWVRVHCNVYEGNDCKAAGEASQVINECKPMCDESSGGRCPDKMTCEFSRKARGIYSSGKVTLKLYYFLRSFRCLCCHPPGSYPVTCILIRWGNILILIRNILVRNILIRNIWIYPSAVNKI